MIFLLIQSHFIGIEVKVPKIVLRGRASTRKEFIAWAMKLMWS